LLVLGLNTMENASAALVRDNRIIAAAEEERFTRKKHQEGVPVNAIKYCLNEGGASLSDVEIVALGWQPWRLWQRGVQTLGFALTSPRHFLIKARRGTRQVAGGEWSRMISLPRKLPELLGEDPQNCKYRFKYIDHHLAHAASAFYPSPFEKSGVLTLDGAGESACITFNLGQGGKISLLKTIKLPHSLGHLYSAVTGFLGFRMCSGEGKVMGLAPYGQDHYPEFFKNMIALLPEGGLKMDFSRLDYHLAQENIFLPAVIRELGEPRKPEAPLEARHQDIAASLQFALERAVLHLAEHLHQLTGTEMLCLAGGVALNATMNRLLLEKSEFKRIFVQPAASDAGTALGAALAAAPPGSMDQRHVLKNVFLGPAFGDDRVEKAIQQKGLKAIRFPDIARATATLLAQGKVVGWFQGRMEFGPRALGNRSILADPRKAEMKDIVNQRVKHREMFRPFAPSALEERAEEFFVPPVETPFMTQVVPVRDSAKGLIPAVVHVDGTGRLQTIARDENPLFHDLIEKFCSLTSVPVVLNTSFNVRGQPIVCAPEEAIECYLNTGMDALAAGNFMLAKNPRDLDGLGK
jgi:carbamoyltransferase